MASSMMRILCRQLPRVAAAAPRPAVRQVATRAGRAGGGGGGKLGRPIAGLAVASGIVLGYYVHTAGVRPAMVAHAAAKKARQMELTREERFRMFASLEYEGHPYMTPKDFLHSVVKDEPRHRVGRLKLSKSDVEEVLNAVPKRTASLETGSQLFTKLQDRGIISYTEYLFLLCILTRPQSHFKMAFNIFDTDGNQRVDKYEFQRILNLFGRLADRDKEVIDSASEMSNAMPDVDTSVLVFLFGSKGKLLLKYNDFHKFIDNLQTEVLEMEFNEFSKGKNIITEEDFARIILRYTSEHNVEQEFIKRLRHRIQEERQGIQQEVSFREFKQFCQFLNNLDTFIAAMNLYSFTDYAVTQNEFQRAVKISTGFLLEDHVIDTVFKLFDDNYDGFISNDEFISRMRDRLHMGFRGSTRVSVSSFM